MVCWKCQIHSFDTMCFPFSHQHSVWMYDGLMDSRMIVMVMRSDGWSPGNVCPDCKWSIWRRIGRGSHGCSGALYIWDNYNWNVILGLRLVIVWSHRYNAASLEIVKNFLWVSKYVNESMLTWVLVNHIPYWFSLFPNVLRHSHCLSSSYHCVCVFLGR